MKESHSINLLRNLANEGIKIFSIADAKKIATKIGMKSNYVVESLHHLMKQGWIIRLKRGLYTFSSESGFAFPAHDFAIAMALVIPSAISHWTAMHYHHLTQQIPKKIFAITPKGSAISRSISKKKFHFIQIKKEHYFGIKTYWIEQQQVQITDPERTLLDGLMKPQYCGDFYEVLNAFKMHSTKIDLKKICDYAQKLDTAVIKRLGWILEKMHFKSKFINELRRLPIKGFRKLDPSGDICGPYNKKWMIQENIG